MFRSKAMIRVSLWFLIASCISAVGAQEDRAGWSDRVPRVAGAKNYFVSADGKPDNAGTKESPWDMASVFASKQKVAPGDVVWVRGGQYRGVEPAPTPPNLSLSLAGSKDAPIHIRAVPGERAAILDQQLATTETASHLWIWDLEIASSSTPERRKSPSAPELQQGAPTHNGLYLRWNDGCKFINLVLRDNPGGGCGWWSDPREGDEGSEMHGCLIYDNGWHTHEPKHGHCIYVQNQKGTKTISGCIMSVPEGDPHSIYAYGTERAYVDNFIIEDNIVHDRGPVLIGGGRPSHNIRVLRNMLYGVDMQIGFASGNRDCVVQGNVIVGGELKIKDYATVVDKNNRRGLSGDAGSLTPNKYDPNRAHIALYAKKDGAKGDARTVKFEISPSFLKAGDAFRVLDPKDPFGEPVVAGKHDGSSIALPMKGEFAAFVITK